jgi:hypothetical protein
MFAKRQDFVLARKALRQMDVMHDALITAWAETFYSTTKHLTMAEAKQKACIKFREEIQAFDFGEM